MRDYPNGGFFFIDAAPIIAAGKTGLKIDGIFEDAKRAIEAGKLFVITDRLNDRRPASAFVCYAGIDNDGAVNIADAPGGTYGYCYITDEDVIIWNEE